MKERLHPRSLCLVLSAALVAASLASGLAAAAPPAPAGDQDYVSMHNYMVQTEIPNVYQVTLSLQTPPLAVTPGPVYVAITLDASGTMAFEDIWDSTGKYTADGQPGEVSRHLAMDAAVGATIDALIDNGNPLIYINLSTHDGNSYDQFNAGSPGTPSGMPEVLDDIKDASQFVSLYNAAGNLRPQFDRDSPAWIMKNWQAWSIDGIMPGTPGNENGWGGYWDSNDFALAFSRLHGFFRDGLVNGSIPTDSVRYIFAMGDGDDWGGEPFFATVDRSTMEWATALKAPLDENYKYPGGSATEAKTVMGAGGGTEAVIWGVTVGARAIHHRDSWSTDILSLSGGLPAWSSIWTARLHPKAQPRMIANTMAIPQAQIDDGSIYYDDSHWKVWSDDIIDDYVTWWTDAGMVVDNSALGNTHYLHSQFLDTQPGGYEGESLLNAFHSFGATAAGAAISIHTNMEGVMELGPAFELYHYPGEPLVALTSSDPRTVQSYSLSGQRSIRWKIERLKTNSYLTMRFYVKMGTDLDPQLHYPLFEEATMTYIPSEETEPVTKRFPMAYVAPGGETRDGIGGGYSPGDPSLPTDNGKSGGSGHQENRDLKDSPGSDWAGGIRDIDPGVTGVKTGKDASGREKVFVELKSGATMRFQWQFKNAAGEWEDIFGANASHYTLGRQFALNQAYQLRCRITNQADKITYTDVIEAMRTVDGAEDLQAKEEGPAIEGENLMDAGEEVDVANTATNGQILALIAGTALLACLTAAAIAISRRREK